MTFVSFALAGMVGLLSYSIGYNTFRIRRRHPRMVRRVDSPRPATVAGPTPLKAAPHVESPVRTTEGAAVVAAPSADEHRALNLVGISPAA